MDEPYLCRRDRASASLSPSRRLDEDRDGDEDALYLDEGTLYEPVYFYLHLKARFHSYRESGVYT